MDNHQKSWPRGADIKAALVARCDAYCATTGTPATSLSLALTKNPNTLTRLREGRDIGIRVYDACAAALTRLEELAGYRSSQEWPKGADLLKSLINRCDIYCAVTGATTTGLSKAIGGNTALLGRLREATDIKLGSYDAYMTALDAIEDTVLRAFGVNNNNGEHHDPQSTGNGHHPETTAGGQHDERPGEALHRTDRESAGGEAEALNRDR